MSATDDPMHMPEMSAEQSLNVVERLSPVGVERRRVFGALLRALTASEGS